MAPLTFFRAAAYFVLVTVVVLLVRQQHKDEAEVRSLDLKGGVEEDVDENAFLIQAHKEIPELLLILASSHILLTHRSLPASRPLPQCGAILQQQPWLTLQS